MMGAIQSLSDISLLAAKLLAHSIHSFVIDISGQPEVPLPQNSRVFLPQPGQG